MKILVCGSRDWVNKEVIFYALEALHPKNEIDIIHGDAPGADRMAAEYAEALEFRSVTPYRADWKSFGKAAGFKRNLEMLDQEPDLVIAFWDGMSKGSKHTIDQAVARGIEVRVVEQPDWRGK